MRHSTTTARLITILIAVVLTPIATGLLATGGIAWLFAIHRYADPAPDFGPLVGPFLLQVLAVALLVIVVLTGIWSSAGLISVGVLGIVPVVIALAPGLLMPLYQAPLPREWIDGISYGIPLALMPALGAMGLVVATLRRHPEPRGAGVGILGIILAPVLLGAGGWLLAWGIGRGMQWALVRFEFSVAPDAIGAVLLGTVLVVAGIGVTRWSPFALVLPALALIALSVLATIPAVGFPLFRFLPREMATSLPNLLVLGGAASAVIYLAYTAVLLRVRAQARLAPPNDHRAFGAYQPAGAYPQPAEYQRPGVHPSPPFPPTGAAAPPTYPPTGAVPPPTYPPAPGS